MRRDSQSKATKWEPPSTKLKVVKAGWGKASSVARNKPKNPSPSSSGSSGTDSDSSTSSACTTCSSSSSSSSSASESEPKKNKYHHSRSYRNLKSKKNPKFKSKHIRSIKNTVSALIPAPVPVPVPVPAPAPVAAQLLKSVVAPAPAQASASVPALAAMGIWSPINMSRQCSYASECDKSGIESRNNRKRLAFPTSPETKRKEKRSRIKDKDKMQRPSPRVKDQRSSTCVGGKPKDKSKKNISPLRSATKPMNTLEKYRPDSEEKRSKFHSTSLALDKDTRGPAKQKSATKFLDSRDVDLQRPSVKTVANPKDKRQISSTRSTSRFRDRQRRQLLLPTATSVFGTRLTENPNIKSARETARSPSRSRIWRSLSRQATRVGERRSTSGERARIRGRNRHYLSSTNKSMSFRGRSAERSPSRLVFNEHRLKSVRLHIKGLTRQVTKTHIVEIFGSFGPLTNVDFPIDHFYKNGLNRAGRGFAFVEFANPDDCETALKNMDGGKIDGRRIVVSPFERSMLRYPMRRRNTSPLNNRF